MSVVYKYKFEPGVGDLIIDAPPGSKAVSVGEQGGDICVWVLQETPWVNSSKMHFKIVGTGWHEELDTWGFVGTVMCKDGLVFHVFYQWV